MKTLTISHSIAAATLAIIGMSQSAHAQQNDAVFDGPSMGIQGGYARHTIDETVLSGANGVRLDDREAGITYGGYVGYDRQFGQIVLGAEAGFSPNGRTLTDDTANGGSVTLKPKWSADASVRAGFVLAGSALVYGRAGYARGRYKTRSFASGSTTATLSETEARDGLMFGGGVEFVLTQNASMRAEYRRSKLDGSLRSDQFLAGATLRF